MSPDRSEPRVRGSGCGRAPRPALIQPSHGPTPAAWTLARTSPGPGLGTGTRSNCIVSGGPNSWTRQAIIEVPTWSRDEGCCLLLSDAPCICRVLADLTRLQL